jgi:perosamine synthetase
MRQIPFGKPIIGKTEKQAVTDVLDGPILVHGPKAKAFEEDFADWTKAPGAVSVSSCTAGMHLIWFDLGIGPGDEILVPAQTHTATAHAVEFTGARCVFVDADNATGNIDINAIENAISEKTKGIVVVHFLGLPVDMDKVTDIARRNNLFVLEDCALAVGTKYKETHAGLLGDAGVFSFYPVKHMTTAEGGMIISRDTDLLNRLQRKKAFGVDRTVGERKIPGVYDVNMLGYNYRMNELQAVIGSCQLERMEGFLNRRRENEKVLRKGVAEIDEISVLEKSSSDFTSSYYCFSVILKENLREKRFEIVKSLNDSGIGTSVYYPKPVPHMSYYLNKYGYDNASYPMASRISYGSIALPVGPHLSGEDMQYMVRNVKKAIKEVNK